MADKKPKSSEVPHVQADRGSTSVGSLNVGNVDGDIAIGNNISIVHYHTANGEKREMRTGWFFGHRYGDLDSFTGRAAEMDMLNTWLNNDKDNLLMLRALGGFGKSALAWTWFNRVDRAQWQTAVWWSFYEKESGFESFLSETLKHLGVEVKESTRQQVNDLLEALRGTNILIVLDGFERLLRQYGRMDAALQSDDEDADIDPSQRDCSSPLTETFLRGLSGAGTKSKVLMTTRLPPRALESADGKLLKGCRDESLSAFSPEDAVTYFHNEGIKATRVEIIEACAAYGYHPLSLSLLAGFINEDHEHRGDIEAVKNLEIFEDVRARRHHVLERAYESLAPARRDLLSKISCFRGSMEYAVLKKVFPSANLDKALLDLRKRGLLQYAGETQRYDLHPIVRHYAYDHFTDEKRRKEAHVQLAKHFSDNMPVTKTKVKTLEDLTPVVELYHHTVRANEWVAALDLFSDRLAEPLRYDFGSNHLIIELLNVFYDENNMFQSALSITDQSWIAHFLAGSYACIGNPRYAEQLHEQHNIDSEKKNDKTSLAVGLVNTARCQITIGKLQQAETNLNRAFDFYQYLDSESGRGTTSYELGRVSFIVGKWEDAISHLETALAYKTDLDALSYQAQAIISGYYTIGALLFKRYRKFNNISIAVEETRYDENQWAMREHTIDDFYRWYQQFALELRQKNFASFISSSPIKFAESAKGDETAIGRVREMWLIGAAYCADGEWKKAEENLSKALNLCRQINLVEFEADILLDFARLRYAQSEFKDAQEKASEALMITERSGYVLQGADVNLFLVQYALEQEKDKAKAKEYAESALRLAYCDGPPYYYKVAYEEAERMITRLNEE